MKKLFFVLLLALLPVSVFPGEYALEKGKDESEGAFNRRQYRSQLYGQAEYVIKKGHGVEMCEVYKKDLERLKIPDAMMCQIWMWDDPDYKFSDDFKRFIWKRVDLKKNRKLFRNFLIYTGSSLYNNDRLVDEEIKAREQHDRGIEADFYTLITDLDNDGKKETVLLDRIGLM